MNGAANAVLVSARGVRKGYGDIAVLDDATFDIPPGITGLLGANGSGKTTLLGMILGLHPVDGGRALGVRAATRGVAAQRYEPSPATHRSITPSLPIFGPTSSVRHVAELHGLPGPEATTRASDALWLVGLGEERFRPMGTMSTGQRQRVKLAQAIAHDPRLILLDEPTDGLDPVQRDAMLDLIRKVATSFEINVLLSSHLLDEVERICDNAVIIGEGRTLASGPLSVLRGERRPGAHTCRRRIGPSDRCGGQTPRIDRSDRHGRRGEAHRRRLRGSRRSSTTRRSSSIMPATRAWPLRLAIVRLGRRRLSLEDVFLEKLG